MTLNEDGKSMISKKSALISAALSGLMLTAGCAGIDGSTGGTQVSMDNVMA